MVLTVRQLSEVSRLGLEVWAGKPGLEREVFRAQVSELSDPWAWLDPGSLVMTTGMGLPKDPQDQGRYIELLDDHGLSALLVGEHPGESINAPELSEALAQASRERAFPVLTMPYRMPFSGVAEIVSQAASVQEHERVLQALRVYDTVRLTIPTSEGNLLPRLAKIVQCDLYLLNPSTGRAVVSGDGARDGKHMPEDLLRSLRLSCNEEGRLARSTVHLSSERGSAVALSVPSSRSAALVALSHEEREPDLSVLRHAAAALAIEVERETAERERKHRLGMELLSDLIEGRVEEVAASRMLADLALSVSSLIIAAVSGAVTLSEEELILQLEDLGIKPLVRRRAGDIVILLENDLARRLLACEIDGPVGLSAPLGRLSRTPEAVREALWALWKAREASGGFVEYGIEEGAPFLPRTISGSQAAVRSVLGPLLDYDAENETRLIATLGAYLGSGRSLKATAATMRIHRQTVVYRIKRVEELTGLRLERMDDVANLWLALKSLEILENLDVRL